MDSTQGRLVFQIDGAAQISPRYLAGSELVSSALGLASSLSAIFTITSSEGFRTPR